MTKRIYGQKRTKKPEPPVAEADARARVKPGSTQSDNLPEQEDAGQPTPARSGKKRRAKQPAAEEITCQMGKFSRAWRVLGFILMMGLNFGIIGGDLMGGKAYVHLSWQREAVSTVLLVLFNGLVLFPIIFEAWYVKVDKEKIELKTMLWRATRQWDQVTDFKNPVYMKLAMLRTGRLFYFLNKRVLPDYPILESIILRRWRR